MGLYVIEQIEQVAGTHELEQYPLPVHSGRDLESLELRQPPRLAVQQVERVAVANPVAEMSEQLQFRRLVEVTVLAEFAPNPGQSRHEQATQKVEVEARIILNRMNRVPELDPLVVRVVPAAQADRRAEIIPFCLKETQRIVVVQEDEGGRDSGVVVLQPLEHVCDLFRRPRHRCASLAKLLVSLS